LLLLLLLLLELQDALSDCPEGGEDDVSILLKSFNGGATEV
jgi:hypothetical protein